MVRRRKPCKGALIPASAGRTSLPRPCGAANSLENRTQAFDGCAVFGLGYRIPAPAGLRQTGRLNGASNRPIPAAGKIYFLDSGREGLTVPTALCKLTYSIGNVCLSRKTDLRFEDLRFETGGAKHY